MRWTKRVQNRCKGCGDTWFPKGRNLSHKCPNCGSRNVTYAGCGCCGCLALLVASGIAAMVLFAAFYAAPKSPDPAPTLALVRPVSGSTPALPPVVPVEKQSSDTPRPEPRTEADFQAEAVRRYPDLAVAGSKMNVAFVERVGFYRKYRPEFFQNTDWPIKVAKEIAKTP